MGSVDLLHLFINKSPGLFAELSLGGVVNTG